MTNEIISNSTAETLKAGENLSSQLSSGDVLAIKGELGSGKTVFVKGLTKGLGIIDPVTSSTFVLFQSYEVPTNKAKMFYHFDLYRLKQRNELDEIGFSEVLADQKNIVAVEWPEKARGILPEKTIWVALSHSAEENQSNQRIIKIWQNE